MMKLPPWIHPSVHSLLQKLFKEWLETQQEGTLILDSSGFTLTLDEELFVKNPFNFEEEQTPLAPSRKSNSQRAHESLPLFIADLDNSFPLSNLDIYSRETHGSWTRRIRRTFSKAQEARKE